MSTKYIIHLLTAAWQQSCRRGRAALLSLLMVPMLFIGCEPEPELHLYDGAQVVINMPAIDLSLRSVWNYQLDHDIIESEWYYGWDAQDQAHFGDMLYSKPEQYNLRRYFTGNYPFGRHLSMKPLVTVKADVPYRDWFEWGFWDLLVSNKVVPVEGEQAPQSLNFDDSSLDSIIVYTNQSMHSSRYQARYSHAFYQPEALFSAYQRAIEINRQLDGFDYDSVTNTYVKQLEMVLRPITYIYLTQVILHHNNNKITGVDGSSVLSGMARSSNLNTGVAGSDAISVYYDVFLKRGREMKGENVDIIGGRLLTFGICNQNNYLIANPEDVKDKNRHYLDVKMIFNNGIDSTFVFDVTDQVRNRWKGGVITVELDMENIPVPRRSGGSAFDAVVEDFENVTHEIEM